MCFSLGFSCLGFPETVGSVSWCLQSILEIFWLLSFQLFIFFPILSPLLRGPRLHIPIWDYVIGLKCSVLVFIYFFIFCFSLNNFYWYLYLLVIFLLSLAHPKSFHILDLFFSYHNSIWFFFRLFHSSAVILPMFTHFHHIFLSPPIYL